MKPSAPTKAMSAAAVRLELLGSTLCASVVCVDRCSEASYLLSALCSSGGSFLGGLMHGCDEHGCDERTIGFADFPGSARSESTPADTSMLTCPLRICCSIKASLRSASR